MFTKFRHAVSFVLLLISVAVIVWASLPNEHHTVVQIIPPAQMQNPQTMQGARQVSMPERQVVLEWPETMRIGEDETITLKFEPVVADPGSSNQPSGYSDIYSRYNLMAEASYDVAGIAVKPSNPTRESLPAGESVMFTWKVNADKEGSYNGTLWLSLRFLPLDGGQASQMPIYIREINIQTSSLLGLNESRAYFWGGVGVVLALALVFDDLIAGVLNKKIPNTTTDTMHPK